MRVLGLSAFLAALACGGFVFAQGLGPNEREVKATPSKVGKSNVMTLDFRFKDPRILKVNIPGRGTRIVWYMWYQVINRNEKPIKFTPIFDLVTHEQPAVYQDETPNLPSVVAEVCKIEDPAGYLNIKDTFEISKELIPVSKSPEEAFPRAITGVALWDVSPANLKGRDPNKHDLSESTQFSIFVRGLSDGFVIVDPPAPGLPPSTREKTLQLKFRRTGDRYSTDSRDMLFVSPAEWTYRASSRSLINPDPKQKIGIEK
jgi:hypothetical protein